MFTQLALAMVAVTLIGLIHLIGLALLTRVLRSHHKLFRSFRMMPPTLLLMATLGIIAIHTIEIWSFALLYVRLHAFTAVEPALYFSTTTYASIGYGDIIMPHQWRILGAIEGAAGTIMLGWSTAYLVSLLVRLRAFGHDWLSAEH